MVNAQQSSNNPVTGIVIVADNNRCPPDYVPIIKAHDDPTTEADVWKDSFFSMTRVYRYIAVSRSTPPSQYPLNVVADITVINEKDIVPPGYSAIEYTADTREKALRKKVLCIRYTQRDSAVDAVDDVQILVKHKVPPQGYSIAGDIDGLMLCFKYNIIPPEFGRRNQQTTNGAPTGVYPGLPYPLHPQQSNELQQHMPGQVPTQSPSAQPGYYTTRQFSAGNSGIDGVPFELAPDLQKQLNAGNRQSGDSDFFMPAHLTQQRISEDYNYNFSTEQSVLMNSLTT